MYDVQPLPQWSEVFRLTLVRTAPMRPVKGDSASYFSAAFTPSAHFFDFHATVLSTPSSDEVA